MVLDLYDMTIIHNITNPPSYGSITSLCIDKKHAWLVVVTLLGYISIWDFRYNILLYSWRIRDTERNIQIIKCILHQTEGNGQWIVLAIKDSKTLSNSVAVIIEVWDIQTQSLKEIFLSQLEDNNESLLEILKLNIASFILPKQNKTIINIPQNYKYIAYKGIDFTTSNFSFISSMSFFVSNFSF